MDAVRAVADEFGLAIIEDAAQAIGCRYRGRSAGALGTLGTFSFHGTKTMTTGEGGMLVTDRTDLYERSLVLRDHGRTASNFKFFYNTEVAFKYRMSNMQAAFGLAQLERIDELVAKKRQIFSWYAERLRDVPGLQLNAEPADIFHTFWMVSIVLGAEYGLTNRELMARFDAEAIDTRPFFHPLSGLPAFSETPQAKAAQARNRVAYDVSPRGMNLPSVLETMMKLKEEGRTRSIGVANFTTALLKVAVDEVRAPIACNQVEYHVMLDQSKLMKYLAAHSIPLVAYCPLAQGRVASDERLARIGRKHDATAAQVALKWLLDQDGVAAIPKASRAESQKANLDALKLTLDDDDRKAIASLPKDLRCVNPGFGPDWD